MSATRKEIIDGLVAKSREVQTICEKKHQEKVKLNLVDHNDGLTDLFGWVLWIEERIDLYGEGKDWERAGQIQISELEANGGNPKWRADLYLDKSNSIVIHQISIPATPAMVINYLDHIAKHGTALIQIPLAGNE